MKSGLNKRIQSQALFLPLASLLLFVCPCMIAVYPSMVNVDIPRVQVSCMQAAPHG